VTLGAGGAAFDSHADDYEAQLMQGVRLSGESKAFFARGRLECLARFWRDSGRPAPARIVDYGCGVGDGTALLAERFPGADVLGVDPSQRCVERCLRERAGERVRFAPLRGFEVEDAGPVDLVHLNGVVHHVEPAQRAALAAALARLAGPRGVVAVFENNPWNPGTRLVMARIPFDREAQPISAPALRRLLGSARLDVLRTRFLFYFPHALRALRPLERRLEALPFGAQYGVFARAASAATR
jgi:SAM-dependent methyltransferase